MSTCYGSYFSDPASANSLKELQALCGDTASFNSILNIAVLKVDSNLFAYHERAAGGPDVFVAWQLNLEQQVTRWINAFSFSRENPSYLKGMSRALHDIYERADHRREIGGIRPFVRTIRMLLLFESLLLDGIHVAEIAGHEQRHNFHQAVSKLKKKLPKLTELVKDLCAIQDRLRLGKTNWYIFVPFLLFHGVLYSQCEYYPTSSWEAQSTLRAHDEFMQKCSTALNNSTIGPCVQTALDFVTLSIRYQSAVGQYVRASGGAQFDEEAKTFASKSGLDVELVRKALACVAILEEARNHRLPGTDESTKIGTMFLNYGVKQIWDNDDWAIHGDCVYRSKEKIRSLPDSQPRTAKRAFKRILKWQSKPSMMVGNKPEYTWSYAASLKLDDDDLHKFRKFIEEKYRELVEEGDRCKCQHKVGVFSFGWRQTRDLRPAIQKCVEEFVGARTPANFKRYFQLRVNEIPRAYLSYAREEKELAVEVRLRSDIAGCYLLFPKGDLSLTKPAVSAITESRSSRSSAAELLDTLFQHAERELELRDDCLCDDDSERNARYVPTYVVGRILEIIGRLHRTECLTLTVRFQRSLRGAVDEVSTIRIPDRLAKSEHGCHIRYIANYVHAMILNRAMSEGYQTCDIIFGGQQLDSSSGRFMTEDDWRREIEIAYTENAFNLLSDIYLRNYNTERKAVSLVEGIQGRFLEPIKPSDAATRLATWLETQTFPTGRDTLVLGVDIGATLTKVRFYYPEEFNEEPDGSKKKKSYLFTVGPATVDRVSDLNNKQFNVWLTEAFTQNDISFTFDETNIAVSAEGSEWRVMLDGVPWFTIRNENGTLNIYKIYALKPVGAKYSFHTPKRKSDSTQSASLDDCAASFASDLVGRIEALVRADDKLNKRFTQGALLVCVGVTWPGPVRAQHVAGTSAILENFPPLSRNIRKNRIDDILDLDIVRKVKSALADCRYLAKDSAPLVFLINDGEAAGYGTLATCPNISINSLAVVKLGSGTASVAFDQDGKLWAGPWEGGKLIVDLAAKPQDFYPNGVANAFLSKKTLPALAQRLADKLMVTNTNDLPFKVVGLSGTGDGILDSQEIGLFLQNDVEDLRKECGLRDLATRFAERASEPAPIQVEDLRKAYESFENAELSLQYQVQLLLGVAGGAAQTALQKQVEAHGMIRLAQVLGTSVRDIEDFFRNKRQPTVKARIQEFRDKIAKPAAETLGRYLGDFLVLLVSDHGLRSFVLSGGVVSGETGKTAKRCAIERASIYGFEFREEDNLFFLHKAPRWIQMAIDGNEGENRVMDQQDPGVDDGTLGAAAFAIGEFLMHQKQIGLQLLRGIVHRLNVGQTAELKGGAKVTFSNGDEFTLGTYGLNNDEVRAFLDSLTTVIQSTEVIFTRVPAERIS